MDIGNNHTLRLYRNIYLAARPCKNPHAGRDILHYAPGHDKLLCFSHMRRIAMIKSDTTAIKKQLVKECHIAYRLKPSQLPTDEKKLWHGRVLHTILDRVGLLDSVIIESLDPGYEEETEIVFLEQIIDVSTDEKEVTS